LKTTNNVLSSRLFDNTNFYKTFEKDLYQAKQTIIIESPFITLKRMHVLPPTLIDLRRRNVSIIVNTRNPDEHDEEYSRQAIDAIAMMQEIGIRVLFTVKLHRKRRGRTAGFLARKTRMSYGVTMTTNMKKN